MPDDDRFHNARGVLHRIMLSVELAESELGESCDYRILRQYIAEIRKAGDEMRDLLSRQE